MAEIKTEIAIQDSLVERMDKLARELHTSRNHLFSQAAQEFLQRQESQALLEAINRAYEDQPDPEERARQQAMKNKQRRLMDGEW